MREPLQHRLDERDELLERGRVPARASRTRSCVTCCCAEAGIIHSI